MTELVNKLVLVFGYAGLSVKEVSKVLHANTWKFVRHLEIGRLYKNLQQFALTANLEHLFATGAGGDVTIILLRSGGMQIRAHSMILALRSRYFLTLLRTGIRTIPLEGISVEVMVEVLRYLYTGRVLNLETVDTRLFIAANYFRLYGLRRLCEVYLCDRIVHGRDDDQLIRCLAFATLHGATRLQRTINEYLYDKYINTDLTLIQDMNILAEVLAYSFQERLRPNRLDGEPEHVTLVRIRIESWLNGLGLLV